MAETSPDTFLRLLQNKLLSFSKRARKVNACISLNGNNNLWEFETRNSRMPILEGVSEVMMMEKKTTVQKRFNPERYGMVFCPDCDGSGKSLNDVKEVNVCDVCAGFGLIRKEERNGFLNNRMTFQYVR